MKTLLKAIIKVQSSKNLNDTQFAQKLGVDLSTWSKIKNSRRQPGTSFLGALMREFPELALDVMTFLKREPVAGSKESTKC